ncbi:MAG: hypothetical protein AAF517_13675, partial [Planctomycetota bacterium]
MKRRPLEAPPPAFLFFGVFTGFDRLYPTIRTELESSFGPLHSEHGESGIFPFPATVTYRDSMGSRLSRKFFACA